MSPSALFLMSASSFFFLSVALFDSASPIIRWISCSVRPLEATMRIDCCLPVPRSLAETCTMPFASMSNATSIWGTPRGVPQIEVAFDIDANGIVHVSAKDLGTGKQQSIRIVASSGLTEQEIQRMIGEAESNKATDKKKKELADIKNNADGLIYTTEKALEEYSTLLPAKDMAEIRADLEALKALSQNEHVSKTRAAVQRLEGSAYRIGDALYSSEPKDKKAAGATGKS